MARLPLIKPKACQLSKSESRSKDTKSQKSTKNHNTAGGVALPEQ
jgi:hypothetical protein